MKHKKIVISGMVDKCMQLHKFRVSKPRESKNKTKKGSTGVSGYEAPALY
jgi:hypothetical protein